MLIKHVDDPERAVGALRSALRLVQGWLSESSETMPDGVVSVPSAIDAHSTREAVDSPLLDLAHLAQDLNQPRLRVDALRLYAQSLPAGIAQHRALLLLAAAERESGDLDAAEFTLRGAAEGLQAADAEIADRVEADRALGTLLLDRGAFTDALDILTRAAVMLRSRGPAGESARAQVLVKLAQACRAADRPRAAVEALQEAQLLDESAVPPGLLDEAVEASGLSEALAELLMRRASARTDPSERAAMLRESARVWEHLGLGDRALKPLATAYALEPNAEEAKRLQERLYQGEKWSALADHLARRLTHEALDDASRVVLLVTRAEVLDTHLGRPDEALVHLDEASDLQPASLDVLEALAEHCGRQGRLDRQQEVLARIAAITPDSRRVYRASIERAAILERMDSVVSAKASLEFALEHAFRLGAPLRAIIDHLARLYAAQEDYAGEARLWVRAASQSPEPVGAAYLARAAGLRRDTLADRRGALAAVEAAVRFRPELLCLRWSAIDLARSLGDGPKALTHAQEAAVHALHGGLTPAYLAFQKTVARIAAEVGDPSAEVAAWVCVIETNQVEPETLDEMTQRVMGVSPGASRVGFAPFIPTAAAAAALPAEDMDHALSASIAALPAGPCRGAYRLARARLLDCMRRAGEARTIISAAAEEDRVYVLPEVAHDVEEGPDPSARSFLDRTGRWGELAAAETARAASSASRPERARVLLAAGRRLIESRQPDLHRARALFNEALAVCPDFVSAWAERARLDLRNGDADGAVEALERLRVLGGGPWMPPSLELAIAQLYLSRGELAAATVAFGQALRLDPQNRVAAAGLAQLGERMTEHPQASRWRTQYRALLDEVLDASVLAQLDEANRAERGPQDEDMLASALEARAEDDADLWPLYEFYAQKGDYDGLLRVTDRLGGVEAIGSMPRAQRLPLAGAYFAAARPSDALTLLVQALGADWSPAQPAADVDGFVTDLADALRDTDASPSETDEESYFETMPGRLRLRSVLADLQPADLAIPAVQRALEALVVYQPEAGTTCRLLASAYRKNAVIEPKAVALYRGLLADDPGDIDLLMALCSALDDDAGIGAKAALAWMADEPARRHPWPTFRPTDPDFFRELYAPAMKTPLGQLVRLTAPALVGLLPTTVNDRGARCPAAQDPRVADAAAAVLAVVQFPLTMVVDAEGGRGVELESGERATLVIGEALAEDATPDELRFHIGQAAMLAELGCTLFTAVRGVDRRHFMMLAAAAVDPRHRATLPQRFAPQVDILRHRLDVSDREAAEMAAASVDWAALS
ncbi:MAG: hypothetical protein AAF449_07100, partial [Myxococcota bacterium]